MPINPDYRDLFRLLFEEKVEYLVIGAYAVTYYCEPRYTKDLDILVRPTEENAGRLWKALERFGAPLTDVCLADFTNPEMIYQIGIEPNRIDVHVSITGVDFEAIWPNRVESTYAKVPIQIISRADLITAKKASARPQDLLDVQRLSEE
jgi:hypothetical protein